MRSAEGWAHVSLRPRNQYFRLYFSINLMRSGSASPSCFHVCVTVIITDVCSKSTLLTKLRTKVVFSRGMQMKLKSSQG